MKIENSFQSDSISNMLELCRQMARDRNLEINVESVSSDTKGELITVIALSVGTSVFASMLYDILKLSAKRMIERNSEHKSEKLKIDGKEYTVYEIIEGTENDRQDPSP